jgi:hypothetical protein
MGIDRCSSQRLNDFASTRISQIEIDGENIRWENMTT